MFKTHDIGMLYIHIIVTVIQRKENTFFHLSLHSIKFLITDCSQDIYNFLYLLITAFLSLGQFHNHRQL